MFEYIICNSEKCQGEGVAHKILKSHVKCLDCGSKQPRATAQIAGNWPVGV